MDFLTSEVAVGGSRLTLILTNDDGVEAPGMTALIAAAEGLGRCRVIAPAGPWSGKSHAVTTDAPFRVLERQDGRIAVEGTPADCVRVGLHHIEPAADWVLAGINAGGNLGADIHHSGTVAAAREAILHGRPAVAVSHYIARGRAIDWDRAARWAAGVLADLLGKTWEPGMLWNVNLPHPEPGGPDPEIVEVPVDPSPLPLNFRIEGESVRYSGDYQGRARVASADVAACFGGRIAVSRVYLYPGSGLAEGGVGPA